VKKLGASTGSTRTAEQTATARFWEPLAGTVWPASIRRLAQEQGLDLASSAHFQAATFAAFADALIACWDAKFHFNFWRPVTAIQHGATDGNDRTAPDPDWQPLATTPNFPEYPSGHACATAAVAHTIEDY
jgi:PAP2 superfamily